MAQLFLGRLRAACCCLILLLPAFISDGQVIHRGPTYTVKIDSTTRQPDNPIPFDQPFSIVITPRNPQAITSVIALPIKRGKEKTIYYDLSEANLKTKPFKVMGAQVVVDFFPLPPNVSFDLYIQRKLDGPNLDSFLNYAALTVYVEANSEDYNQTDLKSMDGQYTKFYKNLTGSSDPNFQSSSRPVGNQNVFPFQFDYLFSEVCPNEKDYQCDTRTLNHLIHNNLDLRHYFESLIGANVDYEDYPADQDILDDFKAVSKIYHTNKLNDQTISSLIRIFTADKADDLNSGTISADFQDHTKPAKDADIISRQHNFQVTFQRVSGFLDTLQRLQNELAAPSAELTRVANYVKPMADSFYSMTKSVDRKIKAITQIFLDNKALYYPEYYVNNTNGFKDLQTESPSIVSPQVGLSFLGMTRNLGGYQVIPKITLGVNINFKAINKSLIRRDIPNKDWRNYLSAFAGLIFGSFTDAQYSNLLSSSSLVAGLNYRVNRSFYFSLGGSAFRQQNKNPVINSYHNEFGVYASLLLDLDITNAVSSVISNITK